MIDLPGECVVGSGKKPMAERHLDMLSWEVSVTTTTGYKNQSTTKSTESARQTFTITLVDVKFTESSTVAFAKALNSYY